MEVRKGMSISFYDHKVSSHPMTLLTITKMKLKIHKRYVLRLIPFFVILGSYSVGKMLECLLNSGSVTAITEETSAAWTSYGSKIRRKSRNP